MNVFAVTLNVDSTHEITLIHPIWWYWSNIFGWDDILLNGTQVDPTINPIAFAVFICSRMTRNLRHFDHMKNWNFWKVIKAQQRVQDDVSHICTMRNTDTVIPEIVYSVSVYKYAIHGWKNHYQINCKVFMIVTML